MPKFKNLIKIGKARTEKEVRATRYPIFDLIELVRGPCSRFSGCRCPRNHANPFHAGKPLLGVLASVIVGWALGAAFDSAYIFLGFAVPMVVFFFAHELSSENWKAHENELAQLRTPLLARTDGDHLTSEVTRLIEEVAGRLFGPGSDHASWLAMIERRVQEVGIKTEVVTENAAELGGFRESAVQTRVRIISDDANIHSALSALKAFQAEAENELNRLRAKAQELKTPVDDIRRLRAIRGADIRASIEAMEDTIQNVTDHIFTSLEALSQRTSTAVQAAALATGSSHVYSVKKISETAAEDAEDPTKATAAQRGRR